MCVSAWISLNGWSVSSDKGSAPGIDEEVVQKLSCGVTGKSALEMLPFAGAVTLVGAALFVGAAPSEVEVTVKVEVTVVVGTTEQTGLARLRAGTSETAIKRERRKDIVTRADESQTRRTDVGKWKIGGED